MKFDQRISLEPLDGDSQNLDDSQSLEDRSKPINLGQHALELEEDEIEDELML